LWTGSCSCDEEAIAKAAGDMKQAAIEKSQAEKQASSVAMQIKKVEGEKTLAGQAAAKAAAENEKAQQAEQIAQVDEAKAKEDEAEATLKTKQADSEVNEMEGVLFVFFVAIVGLVAGAVIILKSKFESMAELERPLIAEEPPLPEPQPKPFEGRWKNEAGEIVTIEGSRIVHGDGKQEQLTDLENQTVYTHRMSIKKGWFSESPEVKGTSGQMVDEKAIQWSDGRVWVKEDQAMGA